MIFRGLDGCRRGVVLDEIAVAILDSGHAQAPEHAGCVGSQHVLVDVGPVCDRDSEVGGKALLGGGPGCSDGPCRDHIGCYEGYGGPVEELFAEPH